MNSSEMYLKISKNILDCISNFEKNDMNKLEFNNNLFLNLSFLTKFAAGKNIQENPNFNLFIPKKSSFFNNEIDKKIQKHVISEFTEFNNENADFQLNTEIDPKNNDDINQTNIEDITEKIEEDFNLETQNDISIFNENLDDNFNNKTTNFFNKDMNDFERKSKIMNDIDMKNRNLSNFDLDESYVNDVSTIYHNDNFSEFKDQSILDPNISFFMKKGMFGVNKNQNMRNTQEEMNKNKNTIK